MKILVLDTAIPFPLSSGNRIRSYSFLKALAKKHRVSLLCFANRRNSEESVQRLRSFCEQIWVIDDSRAGYRQSSGRIRRLGHFLQGIPWEIASAYSPAFDRQFREVCRDFDVILARYVKTGQYLLTYRGVYRGKALVDFDDLDFIKSLRDWDEQGYTGAYDRYRKRINNSLLRNYYRRFRLLSAGIVCSEHDREVLNTQKIMCNIEVIPNSIDVAGYTAVKGYDQSIVKMKTLLFCGNLNYPPNLEGIRWFMQHVWPLLQKQENTSRLQIVGLSSKDDLLSSIIGDSVSVALNAPSVLPYYDSSSLVIVPIRVGGGTRIKLLEAFACRRPVVSTTIGAEGIDARAGEHLFLADSPQEFADACIKALNDYPLCRQMTEKSLDLVRERYDTSVVAARIGELFS